VRENRRLGVSTPAGSSYARLETFLFGQFGDPGAQAGTSEQFATAFAVLARATGLPTRVVVGFRPGQRQADGTWLVRGRDALAWPEVYFTGQGWVPFDPTPTAVQDESGPGGELKRQVLSRISGQAATAPTPSAPIRPRPAETASGGPVAAPGTSQPGQGGDGLGWLVRALVAILAAAIVGPPAARALRRARHRRSGAPGAWSEVLDLLVLLGRRPPPWHSAVRIASDLAAVVPAPRPHPAWRLAELADRASFGPSPSVVDDPWSELRRLRSAVRRHIRWYRRLLWFADPRPLLRRR